MLIVIRLMNIYIIFQYTFQFVHPNHFKLQNIYCRAVGLMQFAQDPPNPRVAKRSLRLLGMLLEPEPPPVPPGDGGKYSFAGLQRAAATRTKSTYKHIIMTNKF